MQIPLKRGMLIRHQNHVYAVAGYEERRTGKQKATVHVSLRDVRDGHPVDRNLELLRPIGIVRPTVRFDVPEPPAQREAAPAPTLIPVRDSEPPVLMD